MIISSSSLAGEIVRRALSGALCLFFLLPNTPAQAQMTVLEVITLKYRTAEQVIPVLAPLIPKPGTISGLQQQLIVRTTPANLADIKQVLTTLDAAPRRLLITVRQDTALDSGRAETTRSLDSDLNTQSLQVLEGNSAFIRIGQSVPLPQHQVVRTIVNGRMVERMVSAAEYRDVLTGFHARPRLAGDRVTLEISSRRDTLSGPEQTLPDGSVNVQRIATTVSGRLGEWMEIAGLAQGISNQQSVILGSTRENSADNRRILIRVDEIR